MFIVTRVEERMSEGIVILMIEENNMTGIIPLDIEAYMASKKAIPETDGVPVTEVSLVGRTLVMNDYGVPTPPNSN